MKNLRYIKLFEAFESVKLSKTLKFLDQDSKNRFLSDLKHLSIALDFPMSKFNDEMFKYLSFEAALKEGVGDISGSETCDAESQWINGEFCQGGKVLRTWGTGKRLVTCPVCGGTGIKKTTTKKEVKLIKFWFTKEGGLLRITGFDGQIRPQFEPTEQELKSFSRDIEDYKVVDPELTYQDTRTLKTGDLVYFNPRGVRQMSVSYVYRSNHGQIFFLQDLNAGSEPSTRELPTRDREKIARYSWTISSPDDFHLCQLLEPIEKEESKTEPEPEVGINYYNYNNLINLRNLTIGTVNDMKEQLKNCHFALVLDISKLKTFELEKTSEIRQKRNLRKLGAFTKSEDIRTANLKRYTDLLVKKFDADKGISELTKVMPRALGYSNSFIFILRRYNKDTLESLITTLYNFMKSPTDTGLTNILNSIRKIYDNSTNTNETLNGKINELWKYIESNKEQKNYEKISQFFDKFLEIGVLINQKITNYKIENLSDIEILISKIDMLANYVEKSREQTLRRLANLTQRLVNNNTSYAWASIDDIIELSTDPIKDLEDFKQNIEKILRKD